MNESNDVQALEKISSEVDESQFKIILTNQCIKGEFALLVIFVSRYIKITYL